MLQEETVGLLNYISKKESEAQSEEIEIFSLDMNRIEWRKFNDLRQKSDTSSFSIPLLLTGGR